jgi:hypothetical protein
MKRIDFDVIITSLLIVAHITRFPLWIENARDYQMLSDHFGFGSSYAGPRQGLS